MKRWRCNTCFGSEGYEDWENYLQDSFCTRCGHEGVRLYEFGCAECVPEGEPPVHFWAEEAPSHPCPDCGSAAYRVMYVPMISTQARKESFDAADRMLVSELERQGASTTSLKRETPKHPEVDQRLVPHWENASSLVPKGGAQIGGRLPFGMPRPHTAFAGIDSRKADA